MKKCNKKKRLIQKYQKGARYTGGDYKIYSVDELKKYLPQQTATYYAYRDPEGKPYLVDAINDRVVIYRPENKDTKKSPEYIENWVGEYTDAYSLPEVTVTAKMDRNSPVYEEAAKKKAYEQYKEAYKRGEKWATNGLTGGINIYANPYFNPNNPTYKAFREANDALGKTIYTVGSLAVPVGGTSGAVAKGLPKLLNWGKALVSPKNLMATTMFAAPDVYAATNDSENSGGVNPFVSAGIGTALGATLGGVRLVKPFLKKFPRPTSWLAEKLTKGALKSELKNEAIKKAMQEVTKPHQITPTEVTDLYNKFLKGVKGARNFGITGGALGFGGTGVYNWSKGNDFWGNSETPLYIPISGTQSPTNYYTDPVKSNSNPPTGNASTDSIPSSSKDTVSLKGDTTDVDNLNWLFVD